MEDTQRISHKMDEMLKNKEVKDKDALRYLKQLEECDMTLDILTTTGVGLIINKIRKKTDNLDVIVLAKALIIEWKKLVPDNNSTASKRSLDQSGDSVTKSNDGQPEVKKALLEEDNGTTDNLNPIKDTDTSDRCRLKCRNMLKTALESEVLPPNSFDPEYLAVEIESKIHTLFKSTDNKYKSKIRSRVFNLRDAHNPSLRYNVLMGHVTPERLSVMTPEEMASDEMKQLRDRFTKEAIDNHQMATTSETTSSLLQCPKCKKYNSVYNQVQTLSADEPMTTFAFCNACGHRWRFC